MRPSVLTNRTTNGDANARLGIWALDVICMKSVEIRVKMAQFACYTTTVLLVGVRKDWMALGIV